MRHINIELLKELSHTNNNSDTLKDSLMVWGNHDFVKLAVCPGDKDPILWQKHSYGENHSKKYDGVEHQPLFLCDHRSQDIEDVVESLIHEQNNTNIEDEKSFFVLSLLQLDYYDSTFDLTKLDLNTLLSDISNTVREYRKNRWPSKKLAVQTLLNLGESDIALLFRTDCFQTVAGAIAELRKKYPIVKSYTLIIFPYRYSDIITANDTVKRSLVRNLLRWLEKENAGSYELVSHFVVDNRYQEILRTDDNKIKEQIKLIFGDYDVQLKADPKTLIENNLTITNSECKYRYSKTSLQLSINGEEEFVPSKKRNLNEERQYTDAIDDLSNAFDMAISAVKGLNMPRENEVITCFMNAKNTFINLENYFISLHETRYAPDVYIHVKPIFKELCAVLNALFFYCHEDDNAEYKNDVVLEVNRHIECLMENMQQFLGIVSLSPRAFSEAHGSYMRSANAALKLICAYHAAVFLMHNSTKCKIGDKQEYGFERSECAVLILPSRDARTRNITMFTSLNPEHHISVIEANFNSLFDVKKMLFQIAHEVGHFSGDRKRTERQAIFVNASIRYMLYIELFENVLRWPHYTCYKETFEEQIDQDTNKIIEEFDKNKSNVIINATCESTENICEIVNLVSKIIVTKASEQQERTSDSIHSYELAFRLGYLQAYIDFVANSCENVGSILESDTRMVESLKKLSQSISNLFEKSRKEICDSEKVPKTTKWAISARMLEENTKIKIFEKLSTWFKRLDGEKLYTAMEHMYLVFEDIYSDIYAINILGLKKETYAKMILENEIDSEVYCDQTFLMRFHTVLEAHYGCTVEDTENFIKTYLPEKWIKESLAQLRIISNYNALFLEKAIEYARIFDASQYENSTDFSLIRDFYENPEQNLYKIWIEGIKRRG